MPETKLIKDHHLWTRDTIKNVSGNVTLDIAGIIHLDAGISGAGEGVAFLMNGTKVGEVCGHHNHTVFTLYEDVGASTSDYLQILCGANGETDIVTVDGGGTAAHLNIIVDGHVKFDGCGVGFDQEEETFSGDDLLASGSGTGGTHDTHIDFRIGNKIYLEITATMNDMNLIFPAVSGNFMLIVDYDGDWAIDSWKAWESDLSAATAANVLWPGGTEPATTNNGKDIFSFYWDAENQICYGVASLDFQAGD